MRATNAESEKGGPKPSEAVIMAVKVLISNDFQPSKGLGKELEGIAKLVTLQENPGRSGLTILINTETSPQSDNATLMPNNTNESNREDEGEGLEAKTLVELERLLEQEELKLQSRANELEIVNLGKKDLGGQANAARPKTKASRTIERIADIFAWSYRDMPSLDITIVEHKLPLLPNAVPVRQQLRRMKLKVDLKIKEEVEKQWNAGFLVVWVANIVPILMTNGKVRMCVDYKDLNRANPKDNFPLHHIDMLVDKTTQHAFYSFMDGFSRYNQIRMVIEDREKTTFITTLGTFYYKVMPFGLKNTRVTYQRAMVALFHDMMHKEVEVYVDDMIAKSRTPDQHVEDLRKLFERLQKYKPRLNPAKYTFRVNTGKLLGFIVNERGVEVDPDKVKAIRNTLAPRTETKVVNYITRFISQLTATCSPIFKLLRKNQKIEWNQKCQEAFEKVKKYLETSPVLILIVPGKPLILYLIGLCLRITRCIWKERTSHLLSRLQIEIPNARANLCSSLGNEKAEIVHVGPHYMAHIQDRPPQIHLRKTSVDKTNNTLAIGFKAIKGCALVEQLAHHPVSDYQSLLHEFPNEHIMTVEETEFESEPTGWKLWFDGASNLLGNGIGAMLASLEGQCFPFSARLGFDCTNNMAEYEACAMGITIALEHQVKELKVFRDLALVIYQLRVEWETRDTKLILYHNHVLKRMTKVIITIGYYHDSKLVLANHTIYK
ncbi:hypothetical protein CR513_48735, partial [Mucuna pruriens]